MVFIYFAISAIIVVADQILKLLVVKNIPHNESIDFIKFGSKNIVDLTYHKNTGAAFSLFSDKTFILGIITMIFVVVGIVYIIKTEDRHVLNLLSIAMIIGGGVGNVIDRFFRKFVVDYVQIKVFDFAIFNLADVFVVGGAITLFIYVMFIDKSSKNKKKVDANESV